jgi:hypothetical protein
MTSSGALLLALFFQSAIDTAPEVATTRARLELRDGDCISRNDLAARVAARSPRIQFVDEAAISANVALTSARVGNVVVELVLTADGTAPTPRRIVARSCAEAVDAIALMIAVTLDPTLKRKTAVGESEAGTVLAPPLAAKPAEQPAVAKPPAPLPPAGSPAQPVRAPSAPTRREFGAYIGGQTIFGPAPAVMPGVAFFAMAALDRDSVWAPALFVGATHVWRSDLPEPGGSASFVLDAAIVDVCPLRFGGSPLAARACATALFGRVAATGSDTDQGASVARGFAAAGAAWTATVGTVVELYARLGIGVTLLRDAYEFGGVTFHRADRITTTASLGIGRRWP